jgi:uncharacterized repeat protein (TIGR01451 family)
MTGSVVSSNEDTAESTAPRDLSMTLKKTVGQSKHVAVGDVLTYTFTVENTGNVTLYNVTIEDPLTPVVGGPIAALAPGAVDTATFTASYTVTQADMDAGSVVNVARAVAEEINGGVVSSNQDTATSTTTRKPSLILVKSVVEPHYARVGDVLMYTFRVVNTGNVTLRNVTISDPKVTVSGGPLVALAPGATDATTFTALYAVTREDLLSGRIVNTATARGEDVNGVFVSSNTGSVTIGCVTPSAPENFSASDGDDYLSVRVQWDPVPGATWYRVYRSAECDFASSKVVTTTQCLCYRDYSAKLPSLADSFGCSFGGGLTYCYWVTAMNDCGWGSPSESDRGYRGGRAPIFQGQTFEPVFPSSSSSTSTCGGLGAKSADTLGIRLFADEEIAADSVWGVVTSARGETEQVRWTPVTDSGGMDGWAVHEPEEPWLPGDTVNMTVGAETVSGSVVGPVTYTFEIEADDSAANKDVETLWQPAPGDYDANELPDSLDSGHAVQVTVAQSGGTPPLEWGLGSVYGVGPDQAYESPKRVWLPVPEGYAPEDVAVYYYHSNGEDNGWYPAGDVAGWLVPYSYLSLDIGGQAYLGLLVQHGGTVQLGVPAQDCVSEDSSASALPTRGSQGAFILLLVPVTLALLRRKHGLSGSQRDHLKRAIE